MFQSPPTSFLINHYEPSLTIIIPYYINQCSSHHQPDFPLKKKQGKKQAIASTEQQWTIHNRISQVQHGHNDRLL